MFAVCGILEREGKVLLCKRPGGIPFAGLWEFPGREIWDDECLEDVLESAFFEDLSLKININGCMCCFDFGEKLLKRLHVFLVDSNDRPSCSWYASFKWISINKLHKFRLSPASVILVKYLKTNVEKLGVFCKF